MFLDNLNGVELNNYFFKMWKTVKLYKNTSLALIFYNRNLFINIEPKLTGNTRESVSYRSRLYLLKFIDLRFHINTTSM